MLYKCFAITGQELQFAPILHLVNYCSYCIFSDNSLQLRHFTENTNNLAVSRLHYIFGPNLEHTHAAVICLSSINFMDDGKQKWCGEIKKNCCFKKIEWRNNLFFLIKNFNHGKIEAANPSSIKLFCCGLRFVSYFILPRYSTRLFYRIFFKIRSKEMN